MSEPIAIPMPNGGYKILPSRDDRFWSKVAVGKKDECWPWTGYLMPDGYGMMRDGGRMRTVAQVALEISGRPRPAAPNNHALHADVCTTRACCNPSHLRWGSNAENVKDRERLGRNVVPRGEKAGLAKLTEKQVLLIRNAVGPQKEIAVEFGVSQGTVSQIKRRKIWRHLP